MADVRSVTVTEDVGGPLIFGSVRVACTDVAGLQSLEVLESAELVGHCELLKSGKFGEEQ